MPTRPSIEQLRQLLRYDPETGKLYSIENGKEAFTANSCNGYYRAYIWGVREYAHRVIWALVNGEWPTGFIDHIDGDGKNNRLTNLRLVDQSANSRNQSINKKNTSGHLGVHWRRDTQKWTAEVSVMGRKIRLGCFPDKESAIAARRIGEQNYGFHPNHGRPKA